MEYLDANDIIYINETQVGPGMVRDHGLLESAVYRPQQVVYGVEVFPDIHTKAAALTEALVRYHPFRDGNKRTAFLADVAFYGINGYDFDAPDDDAVGFILGIAVHEYNSPEEIARTQAQWTRRL